MSMCPFCGKVYDESEYTRCPRCSKNIKMKSKSRQTNKKNCK